MLTTRRTCLSNTALIFSAGLSERVKERPWFFHSILHVIGRSALPVGLLHLKYPRWVNHARDMRLKLGSECPEFLGSQIPVRGMAHVLDIRYRQVFWWNLEHGVYDNMMAAVTECVCSAFGISMHGKDDANSHAAKLRRRLAVSSNWISTSALFQGLDRATLEVPCLNSFMNT